MNEHIFILKCYQMHQTQQVNRTISMNYKNVDFLHTKPSDSRVTCEIAHKLYGLI